MTEYTKDGCIIVPPGIIEEKYELYPYTKILMQKQQEFFPSVLKELKFIIIEEDEEEDAD